MEHIHISSNITPFNRDRERSIPKFSTWHIGLIEVGDTIVKIEDIKINKEGDLFQALEQFKPGDVIKVTINRADLESPNSRSLRMTQKVLSIQLKATPAPAATQYLIIPPSDSNWEV